MDNTNIQIQWKKLLVFALLIAISIYLLYAFGAFEFFLDKDRLLKFIDSLGPFGFVGFILLQVAQVVAAPVPGEVTGLLGGLLYGPVLGTILSTIGLTIGSYIAFTLGRVFGRPFVEKVVDKAVLSKFDYVLHHKGSFLIFLLFLIPGFPKDYLCYVLGLGHLSTIQFLIIGGAGRLFGTMLLSVGGNYLRTSQYEKFFILTGIAILVVLTAMLFRDKIERLFRLWHVIEYKKKKKKAVAKD